MLPVIDLDYPFLSANIQNSFEINAFNEELSSRR